MILAFAPRLPRGCSWIIPAVVALALSLSLHTVRAQVSPPARPIAPKPDDKPAAGEPEAIGPKGEFFIDPNAKKTLAIFNPISFFGGAIRIGPPPDDRSRIQNMAGRNENLDPAFIKRYVDFFTSELSNKANLNAVINPGPNPNPNATATRGLERAVDALTKPLVDGRANKNDGFLNEYSRVLFDSALPKLLDNNYFSRVDAMIVLGMAGSTSPVALDLYTSQIKKVDQIIWVKLWAARGLTNASQQGRVNLDASKTIQAAAALVGWLESDPKLPWPAQMRAVEALGSLRLALNTREKLDVASVVTRLLADPTVRPEVRAYCAWALGMMKMPSNVNFGLVGHEIGNLVVDLGNRIVEEFDTADDFDKEKDQAAFYTGLLLFQSVPSFSGEDGVSESGLLRSPSVGAAKPALMKLDEKIKATTVQAYELLRAGGNNQKERRNDLDAKLADLKTFLASSMPKDRKLLPGGPEIRASAP